MEAKTIVRETVDVQRRFFEAIEALIAQERIRGMQTFCDMFGLHNPKYWNLREAIRNPNHNARYKLIDIEALVYLSREFGVNAEWLLLGRGRMFK